MTGHEIAEKLRQLNRWRRGDDETLLMPDPAAIGHWIDAAADALEEQDKRAAELARVTAERDSALSLVDDDSTVRIPLMQQDTELSALRAESANLAKQYAEAIEDRDRNAALCASARARVAELEAALRAILGPYADDGDALAKIAHAEDVLARAESTAPKEVLP